MTAHEEYRDDLPLYAVGALTSEEAERIKRHLAECPACREELQAFEEAASHIAMAVEPQAPPARLKQQLLARLESAPSVAEPPVPASPITESLITESSLPARTPVRTREAAREQRTRGAWFWVPAFATACLAIVSLGLWREDRALFRELREQERLTAEMQTNAQVLERARALINTLTDANALHVTLAAAGAKPQPEAKAVYSSQQHSLVLLAGNLNPLPAHKTYELWLLPASGAQPVPAGTFEPDARGSATLVLSQFADGAAAKGFAVTIENEPGATTPTMPIILSGTT
jgi:anti-sigma-K factor RskA